MGDQSTKKCHYLLRGSSEAPGDWLKCRTIATNVAIFDSRADGHLRRSEAGKKIGAENIAIATREDALDVEMHVLLQCIGREGRLKDNGTA